VTGERKVKQRALTVIAPVRPGATQDLRAVLANIGKRLDSDPDLRFRESPSTHFARFVLVTDSGPEDRLVFTSTHDGSWREYLQELVRTTGRGMDTIWQFCSPYRPGDALRMESWTRFVKAHQQREQMFFAAYPGVSTYAVMNNARLRAALEQLLENASPNTLQTLSSLLSADMHVQRKRRTADTKTPAWAGRLIEHLVGIDQSPGNPNTRMRSAPPVTMLEDHGAHNALTIVAPIKNSWWPRLFLHLLLGIGHLTVRRAWGSLSGITSIHFARWLILDRKGTLLFESNYDGNWESYIDEFVDVSSSGLNGIWANCVGFPPRGCRDLESLKDVIRRHQHPVPLFYSAYPMLTVKNILADNSLSVALHALLNSGDIAQVLAGSYETVL
jgi:hypothetical protein